MPAVLKDKKISRSPELKPKDAIARRAEFLSIQSDPNDPSSKNVINIRWIRESWWKLVTGKSTKSAQVTEVNKTCFELCVFERIAEELSTGDLFIPYSETFDDYREQMITWEEYEAQLPTYCEEVGLIAGDTEFARTLKESMEASCQKADSQFPEDELVRIENGNLIIGKPKPDQPSPEVEEIGALLRDRLDKINLLDVIINVEKWLNLNKHFGPLSGFESRISDPVLRFVLTVFCYGTNIGPTETVRSVQGVSRKQVAWLNLKRTTEARLDKAIAKINSEYKKYRLIECWGSGTKDSAEIMPILHIWKDTYHQKAYMKNLSPASSNLADIAGLMSVMATSSIKMSLDHI